MKIEIDQKTANTINAIAAINGTSPERVVARAVEKDARYWQQYEKDKASIAEMEDGEYVENDQVMEWLDSWGTDNELPCPTVTK